MDGWTSFGYWVRRWRKALDLTQEQLADQIACAVVTVKKIENDERRPSRQMAERLAVCLNVPESQRLRFIQVALGDLPADTFHLPEKPVAISREPHLLSKVPAPLTRLIGRRAEVEAIKDCVRRADVRLTTLTGFGGVGKTRLAIQVAQELSNEFADGVFFVSLAALSHPDLVLSAIAQAMGLCETSLEHLDQRLVDYLGKRDILLILDNFEHLMPASLYISELLTRTKALKILATSRTPLRLYGERSFIVQPFDLSDPCAEKDDLEANDAVTLFMERGQAVRPEFLLTEENATTIARICNCLDGIPLAIELAATRISFFTPQQLLQKLSDPLKTVTGGGSDMPFRQRTLRNTIDWSYNLLSEGEKSLLARLSVFQDGFTLEAAETICGSDGDGIEVAYGLETLVQKIFLQQGKGSAGEPRYGMLEMLHEYAHERLALSNEATAIHTRHLNYFAGLAERAKEYAWRGDLASSRFFLRDEQENVLAALEWSLSANAELVGARLVSAIGYFWYIEGRFSLLNKWPRRFLQDFELLPPEIRAHLLTTASMGASVLSDMEQARQFLLQALDLAQNTNDPTGLAVIFSQLAYITMGKQDLYDQAKDWLDKALSLAQESQDNNLESYVLNMLGEVARSINDASTAKEAYEESLRLARAAGNRWRELMLLANFSLMFTHEQDFRSAYDWARQTMQLALELDSVYVVSDCLHMIAGAIGQSGQPEKAARLYGASEAAFERLGAQVQAADMADYERGLNEVRALIEPAKFQALWSEGRSMSVEQAITYALDKEPTVSFEVAG